MLTRPKRQCTENRTYAPQDEEEDDAQDSDFDDAQDSDFEVKDDDLGSDDEDEDEDDDDDEDVFVDSDSEGDDVAEQIRLDLSHVNNSEYQTFLQIEKRDVVDALRFMRHVDESSLKNDSLFGSDFTDDFTAAVHGLREKLLVGYDTSELTDTGGIPIAYRRPFVVCSLFAKLLAHVVSEKLRKDMENGLASFPEGVKQPLSDRVTLFNSPEDMVAKIWNDIDMEKLSVDDKKIYIKRCIGGAVACLFKYRDDIKPGFLDCFKPRRRVGSNNSSSNSNFRIIGASRNAEKKDSQNRLIIPLYPKKPHNKPTYICAHVDKNIEMKDLLLTCKQKYPDVAEVLRGKDFQLVFSQQPTKFHLDGFNLEVVKVPPEYKLLSAHWDSRGIFCAVEGDGRNDVDYDYKLVGKELPFHIRVLGKGSVIRLCKKIDEMDIRTPIERILDLNSAAWNSNIDFLLRNIDGLRVTSYISGFTSATSVVYRGSQNPSNQTLVNRKEALKDKIVKCIQALSKYAERFRESQRQAKLPFPGNKKAQRFIHNFQEAGIILYPAIYNQKTEISERIIYTADDDVKEVFIRLPIKDICRRMRRQI